MDYENLLIGLGIDLVAITLLAYGVYFPRHQRKDLLLGFIGVNVGLFAVASFIADRSLSVAFGIGLFALLSVIRLRSTQITQEEIGYYFVALVLGLVNGVAPEDAWGRTVILNVLLVGVIFVVDHPRLLPQRERRIVTLKTVPGSQEDLRHELQRRLGGEITRCQVLSVDYVHRTTRVDVRYRTDRGPLPAPRKHKKHKDKPHDASPVVSPEVASEVPPDLSSGLSPDGPAVDTAEIPGLQPPDML